MMAWQQQLLHVMYHGLWFFPNNVHDAAACDPCFGGCQVQDGALVDTANTCMRLFYKRTDGIGMPVIPSCSLAIRIHALLHNRPVTIVTYNKMMQVKLKAILNGGIIHLGAEFTATHQRLAIQPGLTGNAQQLGRSGP